MNSKHLREHPDIIFGSMFDNLNDGGGMDISSAAFLSESLDELTAMVVKLFAEVENKNVPLPEFPEHPFQEGHLRVSLCCSSQMERLDMSSAAKKKQFDKGCIYLRIYTCFMHVTL